MSRIRILTSFPLTMLMPDNTISGKLYKVNEDMTTMALCNPMPRDQFSLTKQRLEQILRG